MDQDEREFLRSIFLMEAWDMVGVMEERRHTLAAEPRPTLVADESLLMLAHKLRGAAAVQGCVQVSHLAEEMEDRLTAGIEKRPRVVRQILKELAPWLDAVKHALDVVGQDAPDLTAPPEAAATLSAVSSPVAPLDVSPDENTAATTASGEALGRFFDERGNILDYFRPEAAEHLDTMTRSLLALERGEGGDEETAALFRALHTLKGSAYTVGFRPVGDLAHRIEDVLSAVREQQLPFGEQVVEAVLAGTDTLRLLLASDESDPEALAADLERIMARLTGLVLPVATSDFPSHDALPALPVAEPPVGGTPTAPEGTGRASIRVRLDRLDALMSVVGELVIARSRLDRRLAQLERVGELLGLSRTRMGRAVTDFEGKYEYTRLPLGRARSGGKEGEAVFAELELDRYDDFNILARSLAEISADVSEVRGQLSGAIRAVRDDATHIRRLTGELRGEITRARMVPIGTLFARFARQVRETAKAAKKHVTLQVSGEGVELDNTIIEQIADPLLHLVQNAIWHGIESPDERQDRGKAGRGTVFLSARHQGGVIEIEVEDDGRGIDVAVVRAHAVERGFVRTDVAATMSEGDTLDLIFLPGFSTTASVTPTAGRGVGMDVVRTNVGRLNGEVEVETEVGVGTRFTLKLPLTVVISDALMVRIGSQTLAVPLTAVRQILSRDASGIQRVGEAEVVDLDGETIDLIRLDRVLGVSPQPAKGRTPILALRSGGRVLAVAVDELLRKEEIVIKSLGDFLEGVGPFTGTTIAGDGRVILVIDPSRLLEARVVVAAPRGGEVPASAPVGRGVVLLVDDSISVRKFVGAMLVKAGFTLHTAVDGADALERVGDLAVDVIVTDLEMPRVNGYELVEGLRRRPATRDVPVVVLTTRGGAKHSGVARDLGVQHYVTKPVDEQAFIRLIASLVGTTRRPESRDHP